MIFISKSFKFFKLKQFSILNLFCKSKGGNNITKEIDKNKILAPTNDYVFKRIFGHTGNEDITKSLLTSILDIPVEIIDLNETPILDKDLMDDKVGILDIKAKINNNVNCDIEMQVTDHKDIVKRLLYYWSKIYSKCINSGEKTIIF